MLPRYRVRTRIKVEIEGKVCQSQGETFEIRPHSRYAHVDEGGLAYEFGHLQFPSHKYGVCACYSLELNLVRLSCSGAGEPSPVGFFPRLKIGPRG